MSETDLEYAIIGAGLSGIGFCQYLLQAFPDKKLKIFESRESLGGTWDLFRYPGIRSDSDMYTFGYSFRPWCDQRSFADGPSIMSYLRSTAEELGIDRFVQYEKRVTRASWSSASKLWTLTVDDLKSGTSGTTTCRFLLSCTGYYNYSGGHMPAFEGMSEFGGRLIHPQKWPEDLDYSDKNVTIIGSGATAITLVPSIAKTAKHVTMVQRSPSYVSALPSRDPVVVTLFNYLPSNIAFYLIRCYKILFTGLFYNACIFFPSLVKYLLLSDLATSFGEEFVKKHFTPSYNPWEQRFCIAPDGDFFRALKKKSASIITGKINKFTKNGLLMESGEEIESDIIVMATGLRLQLFGGIAIDLDGNPLDQSNTLAYKGMMLNKVPNFVSVFGYLSASWTLRSDKICQHFCRILKEMYKRGSIVCTPTYDPTIRKSDKISSFHDGFSSGYLQRAEADNGGLWGRCVDRHPWKSNKWLLSDQWMLQYSPAIEKEMILS